MNIQIDTLRFVLKNYRETHEETLARAGGNDAFLKGFIAALEQVEGNIITALENEMLDIVAETEALAIEQIEYTEATAKFKI